MKIATTKSYMTTPSTETSAKAQEAASNPQFLYHTLNNGPEPSTSAGKNLTTSKYPMPSFIPPPGEPEDRTVDYILLYEKLVAEYGSSTEDDDQARGMASAEPGTSMPGTQGYQQSEQGNPSGSAHYHSAWVSDASELESSEYHSPALTPDTHSESKITEETPHKSTQGVSAPTQAAPAVAQPYAAPLYSYLVSVPTYQTVTLLAGTPLAPLPALAVPACAPAAHDPSPAAGTEPYRRQLDALAARPLNSTAPGPDVTGFLIKGSELGRLAAAMTPLESEAQYVVRPWMGDHLHYA